MTGSRLKQWLSMASVLGGIFLLFAWYLLEKSQGIVSLPNTKIPVSDVMVVLGGQATNRPRLAAELFNEGLARQIIVTGIGDGPINAYQLAARGVPLDKIRLEPNSNSTYENARNTALILDELHAQRVIIVTSWFHARRARACFRHFRPNLEFIIATTPPEWEYLYSKDSWAWQEMLKIGFYWVRYGISPF